MNAFGAYAKYYDQIYRDKNYVAEADYVHSLIQLHTPKATTLLDLGCGTGQHAVRFAKQGYTVLGVDRSTGMLVAAEKRTAELASDERERLRFCAGDVRSIRLGHTFDATVALFHVISYQLQNDDLLAAFTTAHSHTRPGGVFIFDCWYGPGVLTQPPQTRVKRLKADDGLDITRISEPRIHTNLNSVDVEFDLLAIETASKRCEQIHETHTMRYLFEPEIDLFAKYVGFEIIARSEWLSGRELNSTCWNACFVARA